MLSIRSGSLMETLGCDAPVHDGHLDVPAGVGDDGEAGHLRGGPGGGVDRYHGRHVLLGLVDPLVVPDAAAVVDHDADALGAVHRAAAAHGHDVVALLPLVHLHPGVHRVVGRVGLGLAEQDALHAGLGEQPLHLLTELDAVPGATGNDQGPGSTQRFRLISELPDRAAAHEIDGGNKIGAGHDYLLFPRTETRSKALLLL